MHELVVGPAIHNEVLNVVARRNNGRIVDMAAGVGDADEWTVSCVANGSRLGFKRWEGSRSGRRGDDVVRGKVYHSCVKLQDAVGQKGRCAHGASRDSR